MKQSTGHSRKHSPNPIPCAQEGLSATDRVRALAESLRPDGTARLSLSGRTQRRLTRALRAARALAARDADASEALARLAEDARLIEACAREARRGGGEPLPAHGGRTRVEHIAGLLLNDGEARLTEAQLLDALRAFDAVQPLEQRELWSVPQALRIAVAASLARVSEAIADDARACEAAARWVRRPTGPIPARPAFWERALMLCGEEELPEARARLIARMRALGEGPERAVRLAHEARAYDRMRLDNLMAARRLAGELDWQACFEALSAVDAELRRDPAGVYPHMDDASRQAVREQVTALARAARLPEFTVARHAVDAARECAAGPSAAGASLDALSRADFDSPEALRATCCWWLYDDEGRRALLHRMRRPEVRPPRMVPDPNGTGVMLAVTGLAAALFALLAAPLRAPWLWPALLPIAWTASGAVVGRLFPLWVRPARLLKLEIDRLPDAWRTLVTTPVLIPDAARAAEVCDNLEALGCLDADENTAYLLLGDFADADAAALPGDGGIVDAVRRRVAQMNARAGREKYFYLHRPRTLLAPDGRYMGRDRKRGALTDLNRVLLGEDGAADAFSVESAACAKLAGRFRYVLTLDADTRMLPGTARRLAGAMAHPLNRPMAGRGWAVMQPRMETTPSACVNRFARLFSGTGGLDTYPASVSSLWMDLTGQGVYAGKGIYDIAAFHRALDGALPEGRVLSHDLIEGAIARAAFLGDVALYDGGPATLTGWMRRLHRWTRGDWQLLPILCAPRARLRAADRFRMLDNLLRSLRAPALWALLTAGAWSGSAAALAAGLLAAFLNPLLHPFGADRLGWRRAAAELAILPLTAFQMLDAALRALWRLFVSGRRLMDWVPSADAEKERARVNLPNRAAAALLAPGLLVPGSALPCLALGLIFWFGADRVNGMADRPAADAGPLTDAQRGMLAGLARDTWRFFERCVPLDGGAALPPDNVQLDPPAGAARRTSPTNIGLYLLSCAAARHLELIDAETLRARLSAALDALDRAEKWRGHLFNWIDIDTLAPLRPRYVSAVDSGNLAACALACAGAVADADAGLAARLRALAEGMDFAALYDEARHLFFIGVDADAGAPSQSHYDLLASESRILSYAALMLGQIPMKHWARLGRACAGLGDGAALLSWSGTMFEYLMPELLLRAPALSLLGESARAAVRAQIRHGAAHGRPWGVSESGFHAFDMRMNYQYRAFGLRALALNGGASEGVVAPYAAALALAVCPRDAAENLDAMAKLGWRSELGLYEAADYLRPKPDGAPSIVFSHMAHHQGMALCALCNALTGDALVRDFLRDPRARALALLLEERPVSAPRRRRSRSETDGDAPAPREGASAPAYGRRARPEARLADTHLLAGREARALVTADGAVHYARGPIDATRLSGGLLSRPDAARAWLFIGEERAVLGGAACRVNYDPGAATFERALDGLRAVMTVSLSPEEDTLFRAIRLENTSDRPARVEVLDAAPAALASAADFRAHPAFQNLFVESARLGDCGLILRRRPRNPGENCPALVHMVRAVGTVSIESDYERLVGRTGVPTPGLTGTTGAVLNPVSALKAAVEIAPGGTASLHFALKLLDADESPEDWLARCRAADLPERAARLGRARGEAMLGYLGLTPGQYQRLDRMGALLADPRLSALAKAQHRPVPGTPRGALWALGLSGDRPMLCMTVSDAGNAAGVRALLRAHAHYRAVGLAVDLVLIDGLGGGYERPVRDLLNGLIDAAGLRGHERAPGGVWILQGRELTEAQRLAVTRASAAVFDAGLDFHAQVRALLARLDAAPGAPAAPLDIGAPALRPEERFMDNGFGGFSADGYAIDVTPDRVPPAPWSNLLSSDEAGLLLTERGGGFLWHGSSRFGRLTPWRGDALWEGWGLMPYLYDADSGEALPLLPGDAPRTPFRVRFSPDRAAYAFEAERLSGESTFHVDGGVLRLDIALACRDPRPRRWTLLLAIDWLMGADTADAGWLHTWSDGGVCMASGASEGVGWMAASDPGASPGPDLPRLVGHGTLLSPEGLEAAPAGGSLRVPLRMAPGADARVQFAVGWAADAASALAAARAFRENAGDAPLREAAARLRVDTPDEALNRMVNVFLPHQVRASRVCGRTGLYQPGGAYGFRDQLQDMLALIPDEPDRVRAHLLRCAARQFASGDAMHWWHPPFLGVRTRISDDRLFLPWVTAAYVRYTGDSAVLGAFVPYLEDVPIPEGREDVFREMRPGDFGGTLHDHCMRAFRSVSTGAHGLALMGAGDWNDGMNRVGAKGVGESVWLSEFIAACADSYAEIAPDGEDALWLRALARAHRDAVERHGWDGAWYRRAFTDDGQPLGSALCDACRIDLIAQAWAVLAGLDEARCAVAMDSARRLLVDEANGIVRLLDPPFGPDGADPGYIRGYPAGVRENGAQYTHAACWYLLALIRRGDAARAHATLRMLLPPYRADTPEAAARYRVEPYAMAADVYAMPGREGRGGWTWYTGSAAWLYVCVLELLGFERRGDRARLNALLGDWPEVSVTLRCGQSDYRLACAKGVSRIMLDGAPVDGPFVRLTDDGRAHEALFPPRD